MLKVPPGKLPYGFIHVNFFVKVGPYEGIQDDDDKYIDIKPSPLVVSISGGSSKVVKQGGLLQLDARNSYDPDDPNNMISPFQYEW